MCVMKLAGYKGERLKRVNLRKEYAEDILEARLEVISGLTRDLDRREFNCLIEALKAMYESRQKLKQVKTNEEKEVEPVDEVKFIEVEK